MVNYRPVAALAAVLMSSGCSTFGDALALQDVKPWQRDVLAEDEMQLVNDAMDAAVDDHLYFSREGSTGGAGLKGGGCGCN